MDAIDELLRKTVLWIERRRRLPSATYRLQFHAGFTFQDARAILPYLRQLGISHVYSSPYLKARPGSMHGYDVTDPHALNPELGSEKDYAEYVQSLHDNGLGEILDTVPNHMGVLGNENSWWNDVLENGPASECADFFDISWDASHRPEHRGRLVLPVLGDPYGKVLESGELQLQYAEGALSVVYFEHRFPVDPATYNQVLAHRLDELSVALSDEEPRLHEYQSILTAVTNLPLRSETDSLRKAERHREKEVIKRRLGSLLSQCRAALEFLEANVRAFNGAVGQPDSFDLLDRLLECQVYRLSYWRVATDEINYRRFFDVNELAALSMERQPVFAATHELCLRLLRTGSIDGLRIDHPDGLFDPREYLRRLQQHYVAGCAQEVFESSPSPGEMRWEEIAPEVCKRIAQRVGIDRAQPLWRPLYVVVEKILGANESLPEDWPTHGTTGYDFLNVINGVFIDTDNAAKFTSLYHAVTGVSDSFAEVVYQKKFLILQVSLASELYMLAHQLDGLAQQRRMSRDFTLTTLRHALRDVIACFPVYRSYLSTGDVRDADRASVRTAVRMAKARNRTTNDSVFDYLQSLLLLEESEGAGESFRAEQQRFVGKFEQVTSPVMAKGVEDTAFYIYNRLLSLNEVGSDAGRFGITVDEFHRFQADRQAQWPLALSATSTHDTKRNEDVRARLNVLSELPTQWQTAVTHWSQLNAPHRAKLDEVRVPDANVEYMLYQTLLGIWPQNSHSPAAWAEFIQRVSNFMIKAAHESKLHSSWINPNALYDESLRNFVASILDWDKNRVFLEDLATFAKRINHFGMLNALAQTLLKIAAPGVPDIYQGNEVWDDSLVDPDNRRPVDFAIRQSLLAELTETVQNAGDDRRGLAKNLLRCMEDGCVKLYVTAEVLRCRREHPEIFSNGEYLPLETVGIHRNRILAFARRSHGSWVIVAVPRLMTKIVASQLELPLGRAVWQDTAVLLPMMDSLPRLRNIFTGEEIIPSLFEERPALAAAHCFADFPVALLVSVS